MEMDVVLDEVAKLAPVVGASAVEHATAIAAERSAEALLLERVIEIARPALRAVCGRLKSKDASTSGQNGCNPVSETEWLEGKYLILSDCEGSPRDSTGNRGSYDGTMLVLRSDGTLHETTATGDWSRWQGEWSTKERTIAPVTARAAMDDYGLEVCLSAITKKLEEQVAGNLVDKAKAARARAEKLTALAKLAK